MRDHDATLSFTPLLPEGLTRLSFGLCFRDRRLKVEVKHHQARYSLLAGPAAADHPSRPGGHRHHTKR